MERFGDKVEILKGRSCDVLQTEKIQSLRGKVDLVYVDGAHDGDKPFVDAITTWPLLKTGAVQMWDDINQGDVRACLERFQIEFHSCFDTIWRARKSVGLIKRDELCLVN
mgnify:FL=1